MFCWLRRVRYRLRCCRPLPGPGVTKRSQGLVLPLLDRLIYRAAVIGFIFLTLGILTGAVWAETAWGDYWSWDPKETASLITWFIYPALLHARLVQGWQGRPSPGWQWRALARSCLPISA